MALLTIRVYPNPVLSRKAETVTDFGPAKQEFFDNMVETMYVEDGVGLAAPQVGVSERILVFSPRARKGEEEIMVNPEILEAGGREKGIEGCLSFPGLSVDVARATRIKVRYQDRNGRRLEREFSRFPARVVQHEIDHINGKLMIDHLGFMERQRVLAEYPTVS